MQSINSSYHKAGTKIRIVQFSIWLLLLTSLGQLARANESAIWVDVRTAEEFNADHLDGALNIPFNEIGSGIAALNIAKDTPIYLYCRSGSRAGMALQSLTELGYSKVINYKTLKNARRVAQAQESKE